MISRREYLGTSIASLAALSLKPGFLSAQDRGPVIRHAIPSTGEELPIVGLGTSASLRQLADSGETQAIRDVIATLLAEGGTVIDTAPAYGAAEEVAARLVNELGERERVFWATKLNVAGFGGGTADAAEAWAQVEQSFQYYGAEPIDLIQVHNIADMPTQFEILKELKAAGRVRYIGTTSTFKRQYDELEQIMQSEPVDFVGLDYAVDNTSAEDRLMRIAADRGIAVMVYQPFGRTRLWNRVGEREVPEWATNFGAESWGQFFIKFAASHPTATVVTPATSRPHHMVDNAGAAYGRLPNPEERQRMIDYVAALPEA